ncbi:hypothetical protein [Hymenobacter amundsenii]|uniref:hypothetical protein n=1 Tax=Hymenobacter amundsenii TaxID=2006685 RepID=UPI001A8D2062|nr:hypothetical protein [Hymenobacter amundsenii]
MPAAAFPVDYHQLFSARPDNRLPIGPNADAIILGNIAAHAPRTETLPQNLEQAV